MSVLVYVCEPCQRTSAFREGGLKGGRRNAISGLGVPLVLRVRADEHHMKPPNGSMSKEAESPVDEGTTS